MANVRRRTRLGWWGSQARAETAPGALRRYPRSARLFLLSSTACPEWPMLPCSHEARVLSAFLRFCRCAGDGTGQGIEAWRERQANIMPARLAGVTVAGCLLPSGAEGPAIGFPRQAEETRSRCFMLGTGVRSSQNKSQRILGMSRQKLYDRRTTSCPLDPRTEMAGT